MLIINLSPTYNCTRTLDDHALLQCLEGELLGRVTLGMAQVDLCEVACADLTLAHKLIGNVDEDDKLLQLLDPCVSVLTALRVQFNHLAAGDQNERKEVPRRYIFAFVQFEAAILYGEYLCRFSSLLLYTVACYSLVADRECLISSVRDLNLHCTQGGSL